jgi:hypothetical protein
VIEYPEWGLNDEEFGHKKLKHFWVSVKKNVITGVDISSEKLDFGKVVCGTESNKKLTLTNNGKLPANYCFSTQDEGTKELGLIKVDK